VSSPFEPSLATRGSPDPSVWAVVVAGGGGTRFGGPKQYEQIGERRVLDHSVAAARSVAAGVVLVVARADVEHPEPDVDRVVAGGESRSASVRHGLAAVPDDVEIIVIHDAARPAAPAELFAAVVQCVRGGADAAVPGLPVTDSLRHRDGGAVDRDSMVAVQTPQAFRARALRDAHASGDEASDDATLVERHGGRVVIVDGVVANRKLTHPEDLLLLRHALSEST
jgi:2-C-methyl-D-erythritol 4-phosphate cytidylyltransferase